VLPGTTIPSSEEVGINAWVLGFSVTVSVFAALLSGTLPSLRASRTDLRAGLTEAPGRGQGHQRDRLRGALVVAEVALSLVVLAGAGLMFRTFRSLQAIDPGFPVERLITLSIPLASERYTSTDQVIRFYDELLPRIEALPGVEAAGLTSHLPLRNWGTNGNFSVRGRPAEAVARQPFAEFRSVSPRYFQAMDIPLVAGRAFRDDDHPDRFVIINEAAARAFWPDSDPVGEQLGWEGEGGWYTILGVVADAKNVGLTQAAYPEIYWSHRSENAARPEMVLVARTMLEPEALVSAIGHAVREVSPDQPIYLVKTMEQVFADAIARPRFQTLLFGVFAFLALLLVVAGVYGVISYSVSQRTHEMGVRTALGAGRSDVLRLVLGHGLTLAFTGVAIGLGAAWGLTRFLEGQLFGVEPTDPLTFAAVTAVLLATALLACYVPARRAARISPMTALRYE
jgi:putative ABC transport system permease protein